MTNTLLPIKPQVISHVTVKSSDVERHVKLFQDLFGLPVVDRAEDSVVLRVGGTQQYLTFTDAGKETPHFVNYGVGVDNFNQSELISALKEAGLSQSDTPGRSTVTAIGEDRIAVGDADGLVLEIQDTRHLGPGGIAQPSEPYPHKPLMTLVDINHCTLAISNGDIGIPFYQSVLDIPIDIYQGPDPVLRIGAYNANIVLYDLRQLEGTKLEGYPAHINHACFIVEDFNVDRISKLMMGCGFDWIGQSFQPTGPMQAYWTKRMPDRNGAPTGTAEFYFTDHDGLVWQLQDYRYRGGNGYLGEIGGTAENPGGIETKQLADRRKDAGDFHSHQVPMK